ncbi:thioredoxin family protein [Aequorivita echinoideorum]|uniref:Thioredoxin family protein n=1 Tax=Aequorivita echinoideorum TaxID=1549647 RepID=A0ABS5S213_9FLAO|nr:thioredoxin family protein [Aequorivita echinoideorum]MBT0607250.1 thioredoxin family protein [Aequorivita echinoideorum]
MKIFFSTILFITISMNCFSQETIKIQWKSWNELESALREKPKPVLLFFHTKWCVYCKKMQREVFTNKKIIKKMNEEYYAVEMDAESVEKIVFDGVEFINTEALKKRNGIHQIPLLLASREDQPFVLPATIILDANFKIKQRFFEYLSSEKLLQIL